MDDSAPRATAFGGLSRIGGAIRPLSRTAPDSLRSVRAGGDADTCDGPASAEYLVVDTETNGLGGDLCELTEVGAVLVGGGELHDTFESLVRWSGRCRAGSSASPGSRRRWSTPRRRRTEVLPQLAELLDGRVLVAHSAASTAACWPGVRARRDRWPEPAGALHRRAGAPVRPARRASAGSRSSPTRSGSRSEEVHRALAGRAHVRAGVLRAVPEAVRERGHARRRASRCCGRARRRGASTANRAERVPREQRPDLSQLPDDPGVYIFRDQRGRPLYVGKSVSLRTRARAHFCAPAGVDRARRDRRLQAHELGARRARAREPADQAAGARRATGR